jgi:predicted GH43/DUF377 family glycosyl hydrolase
MLFYNAAPTNNPASPYSYQWCMIHDATDGALESALFATSTDGYNFSAWNGMTEVIQRGTYPEWDAWIGNVEVFQYENKWYAYYAGGIGTIHGSDTNFGDGLGFATSDDGITWVKELTNPIIKKTFSDKTAKRLYCPNIVKQDDGWMLYYTAKSTAGAYRVSTALIKKLS